MKIKTAQDFLNELNGVYQCDGFEFEKDFGVSRKAWLKSYDEAHDRLAFHDDRSKIITKNKELVTDKALQDLISKSILEFDFIATERIVDRDGDIVEPKGLKIGGNIPILFNHNMLNPIGTTIKVLEHSTQRIRFKGILADTALGRDMAKLVEINALKISQGFSADIAEKIFNNIGNKQVQTGWHVKAGEILEASLTPVPSNKASIITSWELKEFDSHVMKSYAQSLREAEPKVFKGHTFDTSTSEAGSEETDVDPFIHEFAKSLIEGDETACKALDRFNEIRTTVEAQKSEEAVVEFFIANGE